MEGRSDGVELGWGNDSRVLTAERERERSAWSGREGPTVGT